MHYLNITGNDRILIIIFAKVLTRLFAFSVLKCDVIQRENDTILSQVLTNYNLFPCNIS